MLKPGDCDIYNPACCWGLTFQRKVTEGWRRSSCFLEVAGYCHTRGQTIQSFWEGRGLSQAVSAGGFLPWTGSVGPTWPGGHCPLSGHSHSIPVSGQASEAANDTNSLSPRSSHCPLFSPQGWRQYYCDVFGDMDIVTKQSLGLSTQTPNHPHCRVGPLVLISIHVPITGRCLSLAITLLHSHPSLRWPGLY